MTKAFLSCLALFLYSCGCARTEEVHIAVAANFAGTLKILSEDFKRKTGHSVVPISGATGKLYTQVAHGAPFGVFLSADEATPKKLEDAGLTVPGSRFTYALGTLVLYSAQPGFVDSEGAVLKRGEFQHLAIANPKLAPYGAAAVSVLDRLGLLVAIQPKLVQGENIAQAFEYVSSGNAELGFVALAQVLPSTNARSGSYWVVPATLYPPIKQDAVLLKKGEKSPAARAFTEYLKSDEARRVIAEHGYGLPDR